MATVIFNSVKADLLNADIDLAADTIKVALTTSSYTPDQDAHDFFDDITNEVTGTGYTAGGSTLANPAVTIDDTDNEGVFDADDVAWTTSTITARYGVIYKDTGTPGTSPLIAAIDFSSDKTSTAGTFTIQWATEGILNLG